MKRPGELVEVEVESDPASTPARNGPRRFDGPAPRRVLRTLSLLLAALVVLGLGTVLATDQERRAVDRDDAAVRRASALDGTVASLRLPVTEQWRLDGRFVGAAGGLVLVEEGEPAQLVARTTEGAVAWRIPLPGSRAGALTCPRALEVGGLLVCEVEALEITAPNTGAALVQQAGRLLVLRAADGSVRAGWPLARGTVGWDVLEDQDVVVARRSGGEVVVRRLHPGARSAVWTVVVPVPDGASSRQPSVEVRRGRVLLSGSLALAVRADGHVSGPWAPRAGTAAVDLLPVDGGVVVWQESRRGEMHRDDGGVGPAVQGSPARVPVDDGAPADVLLLLDGTPDVVRAVDPATGRTLWEHPARASDLLVRIDGLLVLAGQGALRGVDVQTGEVRWRTPAGSPDSPLLQAVTDGVRLLVPDYEVTTGRRVAALRLADGTRVWEAPLPSGAWRFAVRGDAVVVGGGGGAAVLGPSEGGSA